MTDTQSKLQTTPIKAKVDTIFLDPPELKELRKLYGDGMQALWIGLPSVKDFNEYFTDKPPHRLRNLKSVRFAYKAGTKEDEMYKRLVSVVFAVAVAFG